jgi:hypothetical protein
MMRDLLDYAKELLVIAAAGLFVGALAAVTQSVTPYNLNGSDSPANAGTIMGLITVIAIVAYQAAANWRPYSESDEFEGEPQE